MGVVFAHPLAVNENGNEESPNAPTHSPRVSQRWGSDDRNRTPPHKMSAQLHAAAPAKLPRNVAITASEPMPINQKGLPVNSSGARSHIQPP